MFNIKLFNKIASCGLDVFDKALYSCSAEITDPDAVMVRSAALHDESFPQSLKAIARAGAGVNNIPLDRCTDEGICVFNTPGANANAVKELALCALLISSRKITDGIAWVKTLSGDTVAADVEKGKNAFVGPEISGKTLGVVGLGAIGAMVANDAEKLGMKVIGYDAYLSVKGALRLSPAIKLADSLDELLGASDYITVHIPSVPETRGMFNRSVISKMKPGTRLINLSRGDLAVNGDILAALESGALSAYVTDFPDGELAGKRGVIAMPHLGASTPESEDNCAVMAAKELIGYLEAGNVVNSVNFPCVALPFSASAAHRFTVCFKAGFDIKNVTDVLSSAGIRASAFASQTRGNAGYAIFDTDGSAVGVSAIISALDKVTRVNIIK